MRLESNRKRKREELLLKHWESKTETVDVISLTKCKSDISASKIGLLI